MVKGWERYPCLIIPKTHRVTCEEKGILSHLNSRPITTFLPFYCFCFPFSYCLASYLTPFYLHPFIIPYLISIVLLLGFALSPLLPFNSLNHSSKFTHTHTFDRCMHCATTITCPLPLFFIISYCCPSHTHDFHLIFPHPALFFLHTLQHPHWRRTS